MGMSVRRKRRRTLELLVGVSVYRAWTQMLAGLAPDGRSHRLATLVAGFLHHATNVAHEHDESGARADAVRCSILLAAESQDPEELLDEVRDLLRQLFADAGIASERVSARGESYEILEAAAHEYIHWYDMPWE